MNAKRILAGCGAVAALVMVVGLPWPDAASGNGGPFVLKYPGGDPAARGILARLDPSLMPARESRLRVVTEELGVVFGRIPFASGTPSPPLASVTAEYTIHNPTAEDVTVDFGFPILRGIYLHPLSMVARPDVEVRLGQQHLASRVISNSTIYGVIRHRARVAIDAGIRRDETLAALCRLVREAATGERRAALTGYLTGRLGWGPRDAALLAEYARLDLGVPASVPHERRSLFLWSMSRQDLDLVNANLGPLSAIGEQKATQFLAQLATRFDPDTPAAYETIFQAWGGDVRERSLDLGTGQVRPREVSLATLKEKGGVLLDASHDPTVYARVDYLDEDARISPEDQVSCRAVLKNLPVIFTYAPMNLLHYQATFPAGTTRTLTVSYRQHAYVDTRARATYQLAYVVHPASLWKEFGPIHVEVSVPAGVPFRASFEMREDGSSSRDANIGPGVPAGPPLPYVRHRGTLHQKQGEILFAVDGTAWDAFARDPGPPRKAARF